MSKLFAQARLFLESLNVWRTIRLLREEVAHLRLMDAVNSKALNEARTEIWSLRNG